MTKISELPIAGSNVIRDQDPSSASLVVNFYPTEEASQATGQVTIDDLMAAYLDTQMYYGSVVPGYIGEYLLGEGLNDATNMDYIMGWYINIGPSALDQYVINCSVISEAVFSWMNYHDMVSVMFDNDNFVGEIDSTVSSHMSNYLSESSDVATLFSNSNFIEGLSSSIGECLNYAFEDSSFIDNLNSAFANYLSSSAFNDSGFTNGLADFISGYLSESAFYNSDFVDNINDTISTYVDGSVFSDQLSGVISSYLSENFGDTLDNYLYYNGNPQAIADQFSRAMSCYISYYGPLPTT